MEFQDKRRQREEKRRVKKAGVRHRRRAWKQALGDDPESAAETPEDLGGHVSAIHNGQDHDATRRRTVRPRPRPIDSIDGPGPEAP